MEHSGRGGEGTFLDLTIGHPAAAFLRLFTVVVFNVVAVVILGVYVAAGLA